MTTETVTRYVGNCQICERDQKLHAGTMVHHGYQRPGHGSIVGDCPGVYAPPYEVSCERLKAYREQVFATLLSVRIHLRRLREGRITRIVVEPRWRGQTAIEYVAGVTAPWLWECTVEQEAQSAEYRARRLEREIERCDKRTAAWAPAPIRTLEEETAKLATAKAERAAVVAQQRAERAAKRQATRDKQAALAARREAEKADLRAKFAALATGIAPLAERQAEGRTLLRRITTLGKYRWLWLHELGADESMVALGIARWTGGTNGLGRKCVDYDR